MKPYGLLGRKLSHSLSPEIHSLMCDYEYVLFEREPEQLDEFFESGGFAGINVTIPYKKDVIKYCSALFNKITCYIFGFSKENIYRKICCQII